MARFSDLLLKEWTLVGIPIVIGAITALAKVERPIKPEDVKLGETRCLFPRSFPLQLLRRKEFPSPNYVLSANPPLINFVEET